MHRLLETWIQKQKPIKFLCYVSSSGQFCQPFCQTFHTQLWMPYSVKMYLSSSISHWPTTDKNQLRIDSPEQWIYQYWRPPKSALFNKRTFLCFSSAHRKSRCATSSCYFNYHLFLNKLTTPLIYHVQNKFHKFSSYLLHLQLYLLWVYYLRTLNFLYSPNPLIWFSQSLSLLFCPFYMSDWHSTSFL